jgi:hypothetical protein
MAMNPPSERFLGLVSAACDTIVSPAHSHDIGDGKIKVAAPGGSENAIFPADGFQSDEEAQFLPSQADDDIVASHPTSSNNKTRRLTKNDGSYKNGGASVFSSAGEPTSEAGNDENDEETEVGTQEKEGNLSVASSPDVSLGMTSCDHELFGAFYTGLCLGTLLGSFISFEC